MQLRYVASELGSGLKRNVSMTIAVILTIWISLTLVAVGLLMRSQVTMIETHMGGLLEVQVAFCAKQSTTAQCVSGQATPQQEAAVEEVIKGSSYVDSYRYRTRDEAYETFKGTHTDEDGNLDSVAKTVKESDMPTGYWVTVEDPKDTRALVGSVDSLQGVEAVFDARREFAPVYRTLNVLKWAALGGAALLVLAAVLQVSNTIRLAAMARRREIGIMRLVGASSIYIQLPFVLEIVFSALVGAALACGSVLAIMTFAVPWLRGHVRLWPWVENGDAIAAMVVVVSIALTLAIIPTLLMTRKYLKV